MIPDVMPETQSPGEADLFARFRTEPGTEGWVVLHSYDLPRHVRRVSGEADFVVLVPGLGVLVLEVKAVQSIRRELGIWYMGADPSGDTKGPFRQASEAMHSLRKAIALRAPALRNLVYWSAVVLPYVVFADRSPEWHPWQVIDYERLRQGSLAASVRSVLQSARAHLATVPTAGWFDPRSARPTAREVDDLVGLLRRDFELYESPRAKIRRLDEEVVRYTEQQYRALDATQDNARVVYEGAAGTGKTLLALETARRGAASGKRVLLVCFNRALGRWIAHNCEGVNGVTATTVHSMMLRVVGGEIRDDPAFWDRELPQAACDAALQGKVEPFDQLVVDEAQDCWRPHILDFLDLALVGGLRRGRWQQFGDFSYQRIYGGGVTVDAFLEEHRISASRFRLIENCRNAPRVATYAGVLGDVPETFQRVLRPDNGMDARTLFYRTPDEQARLLDQTLRDYAERGFMGSSVAVLSTRAEGCASRLGPAWASKFSGAEDVSSVRIRSSSIHAFKGLEAHAVVLTDVDSFDGKFARDLFYIGVTRALDLATVLAHESTRSALAAVFEREEHTGG
jgi:hypothetical protein